MADKTKSLGKSDELLARIERIEAQINSQRRGADPDAQSQESALERRLAALEQMLKGNVGEALRAPHAERGGQRYCAMPVVPPRVFGPEVSPDRGRLIQLVSKKWVNGTTLRYAFMPGNTPIGGPAQKKLVRDGFDRWRDVGIGITFEEVPDISSADIRIGFVEGDGSWSYLGRDVRDVPGKHERTMNFGWDLTEDSRKADVAVHEIGHTLGFPHEHQNPFSGIVWDEDECLRVFGGPPNNWNEAQIRHNILNKLAKAEVQGTAWDPDSIMHYDFPRGVIKEPARYQEGLTPAGGLSPHDIAQVKLFYPPIDDSSNAELRPFRSQVLALQPAQQANFNIVPTVSREYKIETFGGADTVIVLFEDRGGGDLHYIKGDDDSGEERNAKLVQRLSAGRRYVLRVRLYVNSDDAEFAVMMS